MKITKNRPNIVIPTIRSKEFFETFLDNWKKEFSGCHIIIVEDRKKKILTNIMKTYSKSFNFTYEIFDWRDIDKDLGKDSWIIPRKTDCVRSYGYYKAWQNKPLIIVTLDDDTVPELSGHIQRFCCNLGTTKAVSPNYYSTLKHLPPRGIIRGKSSIAINHGGWLGVPDLSGVEQMSRLSRTIVEKVDFNEGIIPRNNITSMCGMNVAWIPEITKYMYFGLQNFEKYGIDRCGDIWAGYYAKHKMEEENKDYVMYTGEPYVIHNRASNVWSNIIKEDKAQIASIEFLNIFINGEKIPDNERKPYWLKLKLAYKNWTKLFKE